MYRLHVVPPEGEPFERHFESEALVVGRSSTADLVLADPLLSRHHARFRVEATGLVVEDLSSRNGTFLNGAPLVAATPLLAGDRVTLGASSISLYADERTKVSVVAGSDVSDPSTGTILRLASDLLAESESEHARLKQQGEGALSLYADRLKILNEIHAALGRSLSLDELLALMLERAFEHLHPEQGVIFLRDRGGEFYPAATRSLPGRNEEFHLSRSLVAEVAEKGMAALVLDAEKDERFAQAQSLMLSGIRSLVAAPLLDPEGSLGMIVLSSKVATRRFDEGDMELLVSLAAVAAMKIRNVALAEEAAHRRRLEEELALARRIQEALLPDHIPDVPGYAIIGRNIPSRGVSGDYFEVALRKEGRECVLLLADVSGKGIAASLLTASLQALSEAPVEDGLPPDEICAKLSRGIFRRTPPEKYATMFLAILEPESGRILYTNAGHNPALLVRASGEVETLGPSGFPIGLFEKGNYRSVEAELEPGDTLLLYTDGITEAANRLDDEYGIERLKKVMRENRQASVEEAEAAIELDLEKFVEGVAYCDDRTLVMVRRIERERF